MKHIENIVIGTPIVQLWMLLGSDEKDDSFMEYTVFEDERYLPKLLVKYNFTKSISEIRRNRKDLMITLDTLDCKEIKLGKKRIYIIVGT